MSLEARVLAQAKINLLLRVLAREVTGYHSIETIFLRLDLGDHLIVRATESGRTLDCSGPELPAGGVGPVEQNLAYRAAVAYADATGWPNGFAIELEKHIPVGAGLGGGSADAGAVLRALDGISPNPLGHRLPELAGELGADVAFMTIDSPMAIAWGRGDRLLPLPVLAPRPVLLAVPGFPVSTADAYAWLSAARERADSRGVGSRVVAPDALATWEGMARLATNDFDAVLTLRYPIIGMVIDFLRDERAELAMVSGSGSAVFGVFSATPPASQLQQVPNVRWIETRTAERVVRVEQNR